MMNCCNLKAPQLGWRELLDEPIRNNRAGSQQPMGSPRVWQKCSRKSFPSGLSPIYSLEIIFLFFFVFLLFSVFCVQSMPLATELASPPVLSHRVPPHWLPWTPPSGEYVSYVTGLELPPLLLQLRPFFFYVFGFSFIL